MIVYLFELAHGEGKQVDKLLLVLIDAHSGDLSETFQRHVAKHGHVQELKHRTTVNHRFNCPVFFKCLL